MTNWQQKVESLRGTYEAVEHSKPVSLHEIEEAEKRLGCKLPPSYKALVTMLPPPYWVAQFQWLGKVSEFPPADGGIWANMNMVQNKLQSTMVCR